MLCIGVVSVCLGLSVEAWGTNGTRPAADDQAALAFLTKHWQEPVPTQGKAPAHFSSIEASLDPESCAVCHRTQYEDWSSSLHSKSMGPGVIGQTMEMIQSDPETALLCYSCHAPLTEQHEKVAKNDGRPSRLKRKRHFSVIAPNVSGDKEGAAQAYKTNRSFSAALQHKGLSCAACHVRGHQRFGPPKRDGSIDNSAPAIQLPHGGAVRTTAFEQSEFCKGCHQFAPSGSALNGKLLENTYNEWKEGPYAQQGTTCQSCHMPDRRHLWRGIHDPEMVRQGVTIRLALDKKRYQIGEQIRAEISLVNTGVGHHVPTYVTPKIVVRWELIGADGKPVGESVQEERIGREVTLDLTRELFDTRIASGQRHTARYVRTIERTGLTLRASVVVIPDDFYIRFYEAVLPKAKSKEVRALFEQAIREGRARTYSLFIENVVVS